MFDSRCRFQMTYLSINIHNRASVVFFIYYFLIVSFVSYWIFPLIIKTKRTQNNVVVIFFLLPKWKTNICETTIKTKQNYMQISKRTIDTRKLLFLIHRKAKPTALSKTNNTAHPLQEFMKSQLLCNIKHIIQMLEQKWVKFTKNQIANSNDIQFTWSNCDNKPFFFSHFVIAFIHFIQKPHVQYQAPPPQNYNNVSSY